MPTPPDVTVVTCLRDEGAYVVEWVAHLRALGVSGVLAYSNDCSDGTEDLLDALAPAGVTHVAQGRIREVSGRTPQWRALRAAWAHPVVTGAAWVAHLDCDEFPALPGGDLPGLASDAAAGGGDAVAMPWRLFGCDGRLSMDDAPTPARFRRAAPEGMLFPAQGSFFKTLLRRDGPWEGLGVHRPRQAGRARFLDDALSPAPALDVDPRRILLWRDGAASDARRVQLNHYSVRSVEEFLVKRRRGLPNRTKKEIDLAYWVERNFNAVACDRIAPHLPALEAEAERLRALPGVAEAEAAARAWRKARLAEALATEAGAALFGRLVLASGSTAPPARLAKAILSMQGRTRRVVH